jgi:hypothetical protein
MRAMMLISIMRWKIR